MAFCRQRCKNPFSVVSVVKRALVVSWLCFNVSWPYYFVGEPSGIWAKGVWQIQSAQSVAEERKSFFSREKLNETALIPVSILRLGVWWKHREGFKKYDVWNLKCCKTVFRHLRNQLGVVLGTSFQRLPELKWGGLSPVSSLRLNICWKQQEGTRMISKKFDVQNCCKKTRKQGVSVGVCSPGRRNH